MGRARSARQAGRPHRRPEQLELDPPGRNRVVPHVDGEQSHHPVVRVVHACEIAGDEAVDDALAQHRRDVRFGTEVAGRAERER